MGERQQGCEVGSRGLFLLVGVARAPPRSTGNKRELYAGNNWIAPSRLRVLLAGFRCCCNCSCLAVCGLWVHLNVRCWGGCSDRGCLMLSELGRNGRAKTKKKNRR